MALRDMMNNYFYGKQGKGDFTVADLPQNRRQLFATVLKVRWASMVGLNLMYLVIWIPAILWTALNAAQVYNMLMAGACTQEDLYAVVSYYLLLLAPCVAITGPCSAGVSYVLRNWARDQHSFIWSDFKDAVKANWKQSLVVSVISGVMPLIVFVAVRFYAGMMQRSAAFILPVALVLLVGFVWTLSEMLMYVMLITYDLRMRDVLRNSVLLTIGKLPFAILIKLITLIVPAVAYFFIIYVPGAIGYVVMIFSTLCLVILPTFNKLITVSYANWLCETYLNTKIEGAPTNIGLRPENWDDTEYRPEDDQ